METPASPAGTDGSLHGRLQQLQCRFTWDLKKEDMDLDNLSTRLQDHIDLNLGQKGAPARSNSFLAYVRYLQGRPQDAASLLKTSEKLTRECHGEESERRLIVTYGDLAWLKYHTGDFTESQKYCTRVEEILVKFPSGPPADLHPEVYGEKGWSYLKFSHSYYTKAIECFRKALELQPDDSEWNAGCAIALFRLEPRPKTGEVEEASPAVTQLRRALQINPDDGVLLSMLALKLLNFLKHREAEGLVERALKIDPDNPHVMRYIAKYLRLRGEDERSIDLLNKALERSNQSSFIHHQLAICYKKKKLAQKTTKPYNEQKVKKWRNLSMEHLNEAVKIKPGFVIAIAELALLYAEEKNFSRAKEFFAQGLKSLDSDNGTRQIFYLRYAEFHHYHTKQEADAIANYKKALLLNRDSFEWRTCVKKLKLIAERRVELDDNDDVALALLGQVNRAEGNRKEAAEFYQRALDCDEDNEEYLSALMELRLELRGSDS
ncbi:interferon-induced protein with tetratricopeptide repeats 5-like [Tautogolabrus adspersus]